MRAANTVLRSLCAVDQGVQELRMVGDDPAGSAGQRLESPLRVISGNGVKPTSCPFFPSKETFVSASGKSA